MPAVRIQNFSGEIPKVAARLLPDAAAQAAVNMRLTSGRIDPVYSPLDVGATMQSGNVETMFRMYSGGTSYWLNWTADVDVVRGPIAGDTTFRTYFTSDEFEPRATNLALATSSPPYPTAWYVLGVTPPITAATCTPSGGSAPTDTRTYVYTFVTAWGEESAPSPASTEATGNIDGTWALSNMDAAPPNTYTISAAAWSGGVLTLTVGSTFGLRAGEYVTLSGLGPASLNTTHKVASVTNATTFTIALAVDPTISDQTGTATRVAPHNTTNMTKRIYRSVTSGAVTDFYFVKEIAVATTSTNDDVGEDIGEPIATTGWAMPPVDLRGIRVLPSGALVGFRGNEICFSEPLSPYAWPQAYRLTTEFPAVGLGVFGTSIAVGTSGDPYVGTGVEPASFTLTKLDQSWPCLSKRGMVEIGYGVAWPCPQGLAQVGVNGAQLLTANTYTFLEWDELNPASFVAATYDNRYYAGYDTDASHGMFVFDLQTGNTWRMSPLITGAYTDAETGQMYVVIDNTIRQWDADAASRLPFEWWSKEIVLPPPMSLGAARVEAQFASTATEETQYAAAIVTQRAANAIAIAAETTGGSVNGAAANTYSFNGSSVVPDALVGDGGLRYVTFELYVYGELYYSTTVNQDTTFRLPSGRKYDQFSIRLLGNVPVDSVLIGPTAASLKTA